MIITTHDTQQTSTGIADAGSSPTRGTPSHAALATTVAVVLTGLFAGFFLTYSASVVLGLARVDDLTYVVTFQAINATIRNAVFAVFFFGCVPSTVWAIAASRRRARAVRLLLVVGLVTCATVVAITFAGSVPLNNELATYVDPDAITASTARADFEARWNLLNLARSILSVVGLGAVAAAATHGRRSA